MKSFTDYRAHRRLPDLPLAAASILGFWLFYFTTIVIRTLLIEESLAWLGYRVLGCVIGAILTFLVYFVLSRAARERDSPAALRQAIRRHPHPIPLLQASKAAMPATAWWTRSRRSIPRVARAASAPAPWSAAWSADCWATRSAAAPGAALQPRRV